MVQTPNDGGHAVPPGLEALDGPAEDELEYSGPGSGAEPSPPDTSMLPGGVTHTTAAVGGGAVGMVLLGVAGFFKRRWAKRRYEGLDD